MGVADVGTEKVAIDAVPVVFMGSGFNSLKRNPWTGGHALIVNPGLETPIHEGGMRVWYSFKVSERSRRLHRSLRGEVSASYGGVFDAEGSLQQSTELNSYCVTAIADITVQTGSKSIVPSDRLLAPAALERLANPAGLASFSTAYGNAYVQSATFGGRLVALLKVQTKSEAERKEVEAEMSAGVGPFGSSAEFEKKSRKATKKRQVQVQGFQLGGTNAGAFSGSLDSFLKRAARFAAAAKAAPVVLSLHVAPYETCDNFPSDRMKLPDYGQAAWLAGALRDYRLDCRFELADLQHAEANAWRFAAFTPEKAGELRRSLESLAQRAEILEQQVRSDPSELPPSAMELLATVPPTPDATFGLKEEVLVAVPFLWRALGSGHQGGKWKLLGGKDGDIASRDDRKTGVRLSSSVEVEGGRAFLKADFCVSERAENPTKLGGSVRRELKLPPPYDQWRIVDVVSRNDLRFSKDKKGKVHYPTFTDFSKEQAVVDSYWSTVRICFDTSDSDDSRRIGFDGAGTVLVRAVRPH